MTMHLCRDFLSVGWNDAGGSSYLNAQNYTAAYLTAIFLRRVLNFTIVGQTNFELEASTLASGLTAQINLGGVASHAVLVPSATYVVSISDVGRILVMKSTSNPLFNSGLFRVTSIDTTNNYLFVEPRGIGTHPAESNLSWWLHENEVVHTTAEFANGTNALTNDAYRGWGAATTSRIILQSPHATQWQLRITSETTEDSDTNVAGRAQSGATCSFAPGFGGDVSGDFVPGGKHLHVPLWWNLSNQDGDTSSPSIRSQQSLVGFTKRNATLGDYLINGVRLYMWGDDTTGNCTIICRDHGDGLTTQTLISFGIPEDEEIYSAEPIHRLFVYGNSTCDSSVEIDINPGSRAGTDEDQTGNAFGLSMQPISCVPSLYCYLAGNAQDATIMHNTIAEDDVYLSATELYPLDLLAGTYDQRDGTSAANASPKMILEPRRMGRLPLIRYGRTNFTAWTTSNDSEQSWLHTQNGVFLPWSGSILP